MATKNARRSFSTTESWNRAKSLTALLALYIASVLIDQRVQISSRCGFARSDLSVVLRYFASITLLTFVMTSSENNSSPEWRSKILKISKLFKGFSKIKVHPPLFKCHPPLIKCRVWIAKPVKKEFFHFFRQINERKTSCLETTRTRPSTSNSK